MKRTVWPIFQPKNPGLYTYKLQFRERAATVSPMNGLARDDEGRRARRLGTVDIDTVRGDDHDQQREDGDQIDLAGIVTAMITVADFPAHLFGLPTKYPINAGGKRRFPARQQCGFHLKAVQQLRGIWLGQIIQADKDARFTAR